MQYSGNYNYKLPEPSDSALIADVSESLDAIDGIMANINTTATTALNLANNAASGNFAPTLHNSTATTYGRGTNAAYGHVRLSDVISSNNELSGVAITPYAVNIVNSAATAAQTCASAAYTLATSANSLATTANTSAANKAPISHACTTTTYGFGNYLAYGHVRLMNSVTNVTAGENSGFAATPSSVGTAYALAQSANSLAAAANTSAANKAPISHACTTTTYGAASGTYFGHVMLCAALDSTSGVAGCYAATPSAVRSVSVTLNQLLTNVNIGPNSVEIGSGAYSTTRGVAIGLQANASAANGVAVGAATTAAARGVAVGHGAATTAANGVAVGHGASAGGIGATAIGFGAISTTSNYFVLGSSAVRALQCNVNLTVTSDIRDKADIVSVDTNKALAFVEKLEPIQYVLNPREKYWTDTDAAIEDLTAYGGTDKYDKEAHAAGTKKGNRKHVGFSAQAVQSAMLEIFETDNYAPIINDIQYSYKESGVDIPEEMEGQLTLSASDMIPFLVGAIKELKAEIDELKSK